MFRGILGVLIGLVVTMAVMFLCFTAVYVVIGEDRAFRPASFAVSNLWTSISFVAFAVAGVAGGAVCSKIAATPAASRVLAVLLLALALLGSIKSFTTQPASRRGTTDSMQAMQTAWTPPLASVVGGFVLAAGALAGGLVARRKR